MKHLLIIGGGHAHMVTLNKLANIREMGYRVSVINPSFYHYYSGMGPGMLGQYYTSEEIRFNVKKKVESQNCEFILGAAKTIDAVGKKVYLASGESVEYDVLSCNVGSIVPWNFNGKISQNVFSAKPIEKLQKAQERIIELGKSKNLKIGVIGGGPAAVELAGGAKALLEKHNYTDSKIFVFCRSHLLSNFPIKIQNTIKSAFLNQRIEVIENAHVAQITNTHIALENKKKYDVDIILVATGVRPHPIFSDSKLPVGPDGGLAVNAFLQCPAHPEIFGGGDCIYFKKKPLDKVGVYAVRQNPILFYNLVAALEKKPLKPFEPQKDYLLIFNLGDKTGVFYKKGGMITGKIAFMIKNYIDKKFMKKFQN